MMMMMPMPPPMVWQLTTSRLFEIGQKKKVRRRQRWKRDGDLGDDGGGDGGSSFFA